MPKPTLTGAQIRQSFINYFVERGHTFVPSASLVPGGDQTLLFTNSGMVQFKDVFLGIGSRPYTRVADSQKCMRVAGKHNDLDDVGRDDSHHTFFEMLGNWSFGDYYKQEAIPWAWELLTRVWGLPADKLWATCFLHALEMPARHAFVAELVPRDLLPNAVALSSSVFNLARFVGPGIAALLFNHSNESLIFSLNGLSFLIMLLILLLISNKPQAQPASTQSAAQRLMEGFRYAWKVTEIRYALLLLATISLVSTAHSVLKPVFSREVFNGEARTFSALIGSTGVGAFIAAMRLAYLSESSHLPVRIRSAVLAAGFAMLLFPLQHHVTPAFFILALLGFALTTAVATINTLIQLSVPDQRGVLNQGKARGKAGSSQRRASHAA